MTLGRKKRDTDFLSHLIFLSFFPPLFQVKMMILFPATFIHKRRERYELRCAWLFLTSVVGEDRENQHHHEIKRKREAFIHPTSLSLFLSRLQVNLNLFLRCARGGSFFKKDTETGMTRRRRPYTMHNTCWWRKKDTHNTQKTWRETEVMAKGTTACVYSKTSWRRVVRIRKKTSHGWTRFERKCVFGLHRNLLYFQLLHLLLLGASY